MNVEFYVEDEFLAQAKRLSKKYRSLKSDLKTFRESLQKDPFQGSNLGCPIWCPQYVFKNLFQVIDY